MFLGAIFKCYSFNFDVFILVYIAVTIVYLIAYAIILYLSRVTNDKIIKDIGIVFQDCY